MKRKKEAFSTIGKKLNYPEKTETRIQVVFRVLEGGIWKKRQIEIEGQKAFTLSTARFIATSKNPGCIILRTSFLSDLKERLQQPENG